jgi:hypothetical protein
MSGPGTACSSVGWADVATKRDLDQLELRFDMKLENLESRIERKFESALRAQTFRFMTYVTAVAAIALGLGRLT